MCKVSVIMPVYNGEDYLCQSIDCILNQSLKDLELICVDDGSVDSSLDILNGYAEKDSRVKVFHQENRGGGAARNVAITHATGKYLYCMDADDMLELDALERLYGLCEEKSLDFTIFKAINYEDDTGRYYETPDYSMEKLAEFSKGNVFSFEDLGDLIFNITVTPWSKFYNLQFVKDSGAQFAEGMIFHDNPFFWEVLFNSKRLYFLDEFLYTRRRHSTSSTKAGDKRFANIITIININVSIFMKYNQFERFKDILYNKKVFWIHMRYENIQEQYKEFFFGKMKEDFSKMLGHERYGEFISALNWKNRAIFENCISSNNVSEFDLKMSKANNPNIFKKGVRKVLRTFKK
ncbi:glycosyltransferase [Methanobrevibacter sp.]|uniref:glycosyltransferase family 2 protein n=1 Tax=Methanobrevibacter sp. TaxID=66852 RepID=UPI0025F0FD50|nr:glycosyltransferase [Methanobrevibacter sp.]MBQ2831193.1 glycosyltransferase [Methanobrevibacter sp.]